MAATYSRYSSYRDVGSAVGIRPLCDIIPYSGGSSLPRGPGHTGNKFFILSKKYALAQGSGVCNRGMRHFFLSGTGKIEKIDHITDNTIYTIHLIIKDISHMSEC